MSDEDTRASVRNLFTTIGRGTDPVDIALLFSEDVDWFIAGDTASVPWIGRKVGRQGVAEFYHQVRGLLISERVEITDILINGSRAVALGELASRVRSTGKLIETEFAFDLMVRDGLITRCHMLEDSFAVALSVV